MDSICQSLTLLSDAQSLQSLETGQLSLGSLALGLFLFAPDLFVPVRSLAGMQ